jgi:hypothetical protein
MAPRSGQDSAMRLWLGCRGLCPLTSSKKAQGKPTGAEAGLPKQLENEIEEYNRTIAHLNGPTNSPLK